MHTAGLRSSGMQCIGFINSVLWPHTQTRPLNNTATVQFTSTFLTTNFLSRAFADYVLTVLLGTLGHQQGCPVLCVGQLHLCRLNHRNFIGLRSKYRASAADGAVLAILPMVCAIAAHVHG
jgi:hypothetical protein